MTFDLPRRGSGPLCAASLTLALIALIGQASQAFAAQVAVVLSDDSAPYQELYQAVRAHLDGSGHQISQHYVQDINAAALSRAQLTVSVGVRATESVAALPNRTPVLGVLVPRGWYFKSGRALLGKDGRDNASVILVDQPFARQAALIRRAFPEARRVGVLLSAEQMGVLAELEEALRGQHLELVHARLERDARLTAPLESVLSEADLLLAVPDPLVFNRTTAQSLFLTSYRYRDPVLGYSRSLTRAGAVLSLHSSPAQIGRQAAEWVKRALDEPPAPASSVSYPTYFSISINGQVAHSLGVSLPAEDDLEKRLGGAR